jgi:hypothetical protein
MSEQEVHAKARDLMGPVLGSRQCEALLRAVSDLETLPCVRPLIDLLQPGLEDG